MGWPFRENDQIHEEVSLQGRARFTYDEMHTAIVEIEAIVNSQPLAYLHPDDLEQPLTPLVGRRLLSLPDHLTSSQKMMKI